MQSQFVRVKGLKPRVEVFTQKLHANMATLWRGATRAFIEEILKQDLIRVDTGMSKASLIPLGRAVKMVTAIRAGINPIRDSRKGVTYENGTPSGQYVSGDFKTAALGEKIGEKSYILNFGSPTRPVFVFEFKILVYQYLIGENNRGWHTLETGQQAFLQYLRANAVKSVPKLAEWLDPITGTK